MEPDAALTAELIERTPFSGTIGIQVMSAGAEEVRARMPWAPERCTSFGVLHGGSIMSLADSTGAFVAMLNLPSDASGTTTIESKTNFFRAVRGGFVHAVGRPLHAGRTTIVVETELRDDDGKLVAKVTQTQAVLR